MCERAGAQVRMCRPAGSGVPGCPLWTRARAARTRKAAHTHGCAHAPATQAWRRPTTTTHRRGDDMTPPNKPRRVTHQPQRARARVCVSHTHTHTHISARTHARTGRDRATFPARAPCKSSVRRSGRAFTCHSRSVGATTRDATCDVWPHVCVASRQQAQAGVLVAYSAQQCR